jgi:cupin domain
LPVPLAAAEGAGRAGSHFLVHADQVPPTAVMLYAPAMTPECDVVLRLVRASVDVEAGSCVTVPPGTPHTFANPFDQPAKFIGTLTPDLYVEYFRDLGKLPVDDKGMLNPADIGQTMAKTPPK